MTTEHTAIEKNIYNSKVQFDPSSLLQSFSFLMSAIGLLITPNDKST